MQAMGYFRVRSVEGARYKINEIVVIDGAVLMK